MKNSEGLEVPEVVFRTREGSEWLDVSSEDVFKGKKVILFALPGAFTPTCSSTHLPRYNQLAATFKKEGVDEIVCLSVNDAFVMNAWKEDQEAENIRFLPDGNGEFSEKMSLLVDKRGLGFGSRSWRYSMLVNNGVIEKMFIEPEKDGDPFEVSDAETMLNYINPEAKLPVSVSIITKPGCPYCAKAKADLKEAGLKYEELEIGKDISTSSLFSISGKKTVPQVFIDGKNIGGSEELASYLKG